MILVDEPSDAGRRGMGIPDVGTFVRVAFLGTPLYEGPDGASAILAYLNHGTVLEIVGESGAFLSVRLADEATGYVRSSAVPIRVSSPGEGG